MIVSFSPEKRLPPEVTFLQDSFRQEDDGLFSDPAASQPIADSSRLKGCRRETHSNQVQGLGKSRGFEHCYSVCDHVYTQDHFWDVSVGLPREQMFKKKKNLGVMDN